MNPQSYNLQFRAGLCKISIHSWKTRLCSSEITTSARLVVGRVLIFCKNKWLYLTLYRMREVNTLSKPTLRSFQRTNGLGRSQAFPFSTSDRSIKKKRDMHHRWNNNDRGKLEPSVRNLCQHHFIHHKSQTDCSGIEPGLRDERPATNRLRQRTVLNTKFNRNYT